MTTAAANVPREEPTGQPVTLTYATVLRRSHGRWLVSAGATQVTCDLATSCLLAPEPGDHVLVTLDGETGFILAVLERPGDAPLALAVDRDVTLAAGGKLSLSSAEDLELVARGQTRLSSRTLAVTARAAEVALERVTAVGDTLDQHFSRLRTVADQLDLVAQRVVERVQRRYQFVAEMDQLRAGQVDLRADKTMALRGEHTVITAQEVVKVDGEQVHVG